jgi:acetate---CoA ligase (ADP-forming)
VLTVGAGGTDVEWLRDVSTRVLPVADEDIDAMLDALRLAPVLRGHRGAAAADRPALVRALRALADCALAHERIAEIEVNPLFVLADGVAAVDLRIFLD